MNSEPVTPEQLTELCKYITTTLPVAGMTGNIQMKVARFAEKNAALKDGETLNQEQAADLLELFRSYEGEYTSLVQHIEKAIAQPKAQSEAKPNADLFPKIPDVFKQYNNWLTFKAKDDKAPIISGTFSHAKSNDPTTWVSYSTLLQNIREGKGYSNIGFVPDGERTGYLTAIDIDNCVNVKDIGIAPWAKRITDSLGATYVEVTVSGTGLRAWVVIKRDLHKSYELGDTAKANPDYPKAAQIEVVNDKQYMTFSRAVFVNSSGVRELLEAETNAFFQLIAEVQKEHPVTTEKKNGTTNERHLLKHGQMHKAYIAEAGRLWNRGYEAKDVVEMTVRWTVANSQDKVDEDKVRKEALNVTQIYKRGEAPETTQIVFNEKPTAQTNAGTTSLGVVTADNVQMKKVRWVWDKRVPFGKLTVYAGNPDEAKSLVGVYNAAQLTTGRKMFDSDIFIPPSEVLIMAAEDEANDTIVPRLIAAQADLSKVHILQSVILKNGQGETSGEREVQLDTDIREIEKYVAANPGIRLIIIDPISSYLGDAKMNVEKEIRHLLNPLRLFAARTGIAVVMIMHFNKSVEASAIHRVGGAVAFTGVARAVWAFMSDPEDKGSPGLRKMLRVKANLTATTTSGLTYEVKVRPVLIEGETDYQPYVVFVGKTDKTASDLLANGKAGRPDTEKKDAKEWLEEFMAPNGAEAAADVESFGRTAGHSLRTLHRVKDELGYVSEQLGRKWYWKLPGVKLEPETVSFDNPKNAEGGGVNEL